MKRRVVGVLLMAVGSFVPVLYADDCPPRWLPLGHGVGGEGNPSVYALIVYNGELIAGGAFTSAGGARRSTMPLHGPAAEPGPGYLGNVG